uniref:interleukin-15 isoform X2 n=1 Tax=Monopterus albus TaxID=43700 RepID=UPI0009B41D67|nr:uncharacterized protein LOC109955551 isoform X2 [Monopterus albus]
MTDFMTSTPLILVQLTCHRDLRAKGIQLQSTCNLCRESHKPQVWLCVLVVSFLSISTCAAIKPERELKRCVMGLHDNIKKSDAELYAPSLDEINENCDNEMLRCYILELMMAINEAELQAEVEAEVFGTKERCIFDYFHLYYFSETLHNSGDCRPCEAYSLQNITIFLERLNNLLEKMSSQGTT